MLRLYVLFRRCLMLYNQSIHLTIDLNQPDDNQFELLPVNQPPHHHLKYPQILLGVLQVKKCPIVIAFA
jgi:hypothetical protein